MAAPGIQTIKLASGSINPEEETCRPSFILSPADSSLPTTTNTSDRPSNIEIAKTFDALCDTGKFQEAADMLTEDFTFSNPMWSKNKEQWIQEFPTLSKDKPTFEEFQETNGVVSRRGKKKMGILNLSMIETWDIREDGKIKSITGART